MKNSKEKKCHSIYYSIYVKIEPKHLNVTLAENIPLFKTMSISDMCMFDCLVMHEFSAADFEDPNDDTILKKVLDVSFCGYDFLDEKDLEVLDRLKKLYQIHVEKGDALDRMGIIKTIYAYTSVKLCIDNLNHTLRTVDHPMSYNSKTEKSRNTFIKDYPNIVKK